MYHIGAHTPYSNTPPVSLPQRVKKRLSTSASDWRGCSIDGVTVLEKVWLRHVGLGEMSAAFSADGIGSRVTI